MRVKRLLPAGGLVLAVSGLLGLVLWLQAMSNSAIAAPAVRVVKTKAATGPFAPGDVLTITSTVHNEGGALRDLTVELEVHAENGNIVLRAPRRGVGLGTDQDQAVSWVWRLPNDLPAGSYTTEVSVYGTNWSPLYARQEDGASFTVRPR